MNDNKYWPEQMLFATKTEPSIKFSINSKFGSDEYREDLLAYLQMLSGSNNSDSGIKSQYEKFIEELNLSSSIKKSSSFEADNRRHTNGDSMSESSRENKSNRALPFIGKMKGIKKENRFKSRTEPMKVDMNSDYNYYYQYYYATGYPFMEANEQHYAASLYAYYQMMNSYDYSQEQLANWAQQQGFTLLATSKYHGMLSDSHDIKKETDIKTLPDQVGRRFNR